jgi:hypothetical protein
MVRTRALARVFPGASAACACERGSNVLNVFLFFPQIFTNQER